MASAQHDAAAFFKRNIDISFVLAKFRIILGGFQLWSSHPRCLAHRLFALAIQKLAIDESFSPLPRIVFGSGRIIFVSDETRKIVRDRISIIFVSVETRKIVRYRISIIFVTDETRKIVRYRISINFVTDET